MLKHMTVFLGDLDGIPGAAAVQGRTNAASAWMLSSGLGESFSSHEAKLCLGCCHAETYDSFSRRSGCHPWRGC